MSIDLRVGEKKDIILLTLWNLCSTWIHLRIYFIGTFSVGCLHCEIPFITHEMIGWMIYQCWRKVQCMKVHKSIRDYSIIDSFPELFCLLMIIYFWAIKYNPTKKITSCKMHLLFPLVPVWWQCTPKVASSFSLAWPCLTSKIRVFLCSSSDCFARTLVIFPGIQKPPCP